MLSLRRYLVTLTMDGPFGLQDFQFSHRPLTTVRTVETMRLVGLLAVMTEPLLKFRFVVVMASMKARLCFVVTMAAMKIKSAA